MGSEGPQLTGIPGGGVLLTVVCFLPDHPPGNRQRLLLAVAEEAVGPYVVLGATAETEVLRVALADAAPAERAAALGADAVMTLPA